MSLREAPRIAVARCAPQGTQHATSTPERATGYATAAQQPAARPHECSLRDATGRATPAQLPSCAAPESDPRKVARVAQAGNPLMTREQADHAHWPAWDGEEIDRTVTRVRLFVRRGIRADDAEHLAERLLLRDRELDDRHLCAECLHCRPGRCGNYKAAGLQSPDVGRDQAAVLQRCPGFEEVAA